MGKTKKKPMKKVAIKRVKRTKTKLSTKAKVLAGLGLGTTLAGFGAGGAGGNAANAKPMVRVQNQNKDSKTGKMKKLLTDTFGVPEAKGWYEDGSAGNVHGGSAYSNPFYGMGGGYWNPTTGGGSPLSYTTQTQADINAGTIYNNSAANALNNLADQAAAQAASQSQTEPTGSGETDTESSGLPTDGQTEDPGEGSGEAPFVPTWLNPNNIQPPVLEEPNISVTPGVPTEPISPVIQRGIDEMNNTPAPAVVGFDSNGNQIYFNNGQYQDYTGNVYTSNIENGQTVFNPVTTTDPLNLGQSGASDQTPVLPVGLQDPNANIILNNTQTNADNFLNQPWQAGKGTEEPVIQAAEKPTATPDGFPIKEWNGNVVTDEAGKTWLWDGQNLNQLPENVNLEGGVKIAVDGSTILTQINGAWYDLKTNTQYDDQGPISPAIINPVTITPPMAYGGAGTWDEVVAQSGGAAGASYIVIDGTVYTRQQWESGLLPGQQGPVLPTVTPETPYMTVNASVAPVEYVPAVYNFQGVRTDNQVPEIPVTLPSQNNSSGISNYMTALGQQGVMALVNTDGTYTLLDVNTGQTEQKTLEQMVEASAASPAIQPSEQNIVSRGLDANLIAPELQVQGLSDEDLANATRQISGNLTNELINNFTSQTPEAAPEVTVPQIPLNTFNPSVPSASGMTDAELKQELAKYQSSPAETLAAVRTSENNQTLNFTPLTLADGTKVTTTNGLDYRDAGGNFYFYSVKGQDLMKYDSKAGVFVSVSAVTDQQESRNNVVQDVVGDINKATQKFSTLQENAIKKVGKLFKKNSTATVSNSSNEPTAITSDGTELYDIGYNKDNQLLIDFDGNIYVKNVKTSMSINPENASGFANYTAYWQEHGDIQTKNGTPLYDIGKDANGNSIFIDANSNTYNSSGKSMDLTLVEPTSWLGRVAEQGQKVVEKTDQKAGSVATLVVPQVGLMLKAVSLFSHSQEKSFNTWMADSNKSDSAILHFTFADPVTGRESTLDISKGDIKTIISNTDSIYGTGSVNASSSLNKFGSLIPGLGKKP